MNVLSTAKTWLREITEVGLLLVALGVVIQVLFGTSDKTPFIADVTGNLTTLIGSLGSQGLVGVIALGVILYLLSKSRDGE
jgi:small-conductance mechanosensitive channel